MQFPSQAGRVFRLLVGIILVPILLTFVAGGLLTWTLRPLQKVYLPAYSASSFGAGLPYNQTTIRWVMKTAPGRKPVAANPEDVVAGSNAKLPVRLSPQAIAKGWRGVMLSAPDKTPSDNLSQLLREYIYDDQGVWWLYTKPMLYGLAGLILLYTLRLQFKQSSGRNRRHEERHGRRTKGPELTSAARWKREVRANGIRFRLQWGGAASWLTGLLPFGPGFRIPKRLESSHILLMGDTGAGKSSAIRQILRQVQERGESAIVYDPARDFVSEFYSPERGDLILNPLDERCPYWSIGKEIDRDETTATIAAAFLPEKAYFTDSPRRILARLLKNKPHASDLLKWMSDPALIESMVQGTPLAAYLDKGAPQQRAGILSSMNMVADSLELLPKWEHKRTTFSTAEWYTERKRWVFLTSEPTYREKLLPLHSVWLDLFILRMMGHCKDHNAKPVWFVLDELASLNKLPQLHTAVTENRKYGNPVVLGFQGRSQLEKRYGPDAEAMLSQPATKVFFKTSEPRAAKWVSEAIGEIEVERLKESRSMGFLGSKKSYAMEIATKPLIMP